MIDAPIAMVLVGSAIQAAGPVSRIARQVRPGTCAAVLVAVLASRPTPPPPADFDDLLTALDRS